MRIDRPAQARLTLKELRKLYPKAECELSFSDPLELAVAVILSAQCTDKRVNIVTPALFKRYRSAAAYAAADPEELEGLIRTTGFFRSKARSIREMAAAVERDFGGKVPDSMGSLLTLRGVARKTANVILGTAYGRSEGIVVDTHMKRVAFRLGLTRRTDPVQVERDLMACVPREDWIYFGHAMVWHGRRLCPARSPKCKECPLASFCPHQGACY